VARPLFLHHPSSLEHETGPHPEQPARLSAVLEAVTGAGLDWEIAESPAAASEDVELVHPGRYVRAIEEACLSGGRSLDPDTVVSEGSWEAALHGVGGAMAIVDALLGGEAPAAFSAHRPPGHHAERSRAMGFCLFGNVAIAARHAQRAHGIRRVLIVDWDVHHGNGTNEIFHEDAEVAFTSLHQWPFYPGTGALSDRGAGHGEGKTLNLPVSAGSGDALWCSLVEHVVVPWGREHGPELILVSAGYDAHADDPLGGCTVSDRGFATMTRSVAGLGAELGVPVGYVLEGGYDLAALARNVVGTMAEAGREAVERPELAVHPAAAELAARLQRGDTSLA
jgi:acetoin utilization deacetylase AcuC-like enzyme